MIHTLELILGLSSCEYSNMLDVFTRLKEKERRADEILEKKKRPVVVSSIRLDKSRNSGIKKLSLMRTIWNDKTFVIIKLEPQIMLEEKRTIRLFNPIHENIEILRDRFMEEMKKCLRTTNRLTDLYVWDVNRLDITYNFVLQNTKERDVFLDIIKRTSRLVRTKPKVMKKTSKKNQSTAEGNHSFKFMAYDKHRQINDVYNSIGYDEKIRLLKESENTVRIEVQLYKRKLRSIQKKLNFPNRNILNYLKKEWQDELFFKQYRNSIGIGDFYSLYKAREKLFEQNPKPKMFEKLLNFLELLSQSRSIDASKKKFIKGTIVNKKLVKGSLRTFNTYLNKLNEMGINPITLPRRWGIDFLQNPIRKFQ